MASKKTKKKQQAEQKDPKRQQTTKISNDKPTKAPAGKKVTQIETDNKTNKATTTSNMDSKKKSDTNVVTATVIKPTSNNKHGPPVAFTKKSNVDGLTQRGKAGMAATVFCTTFMIWIWFFALSLCRINPSLLQKELSSSVSTCNFVSNLSLCKATWYTTKRLQDYQILYIEEEDDEDEEEETKEPNIVQKLWHRIKMKSKDEL